VRLRQVGHGDPDVIAATQPGDATRRHRRFLQAWLYPIKSNSSNLSLERTLIPAQMYASTGKRGNPDMLKAVDDLRLLQHEFNAGDGSSSSSSVLTCTGTGARSAG
jgi:hypothetical protein